MNILVTGGAGFIGSHTVVSLVNAGYNPVIVDDFSNSKKSVLQGLKAILGKEIPCYPIDCNDYSQVRKVVHDEKIEGVIHFAAYKSVGESMREPLSYYRNNIGNLLTLLDVLRSSGVDKLIFSSSCTVYGEPDELPVTESSPVKPAVSVYGNTKQIGEEILRDVAAVNPVKIASLRYFNPIGAHPSALIGELPLGIPSNLVPFITQTAIGIRQTLTVFGHDYPTPDGSCIRDYIHVMDLAEAHVSALNFLVKSAQSSLYETFNIGTGKGNSVLELIKVFEAVSARPLNYKIGPRREGDVVAVWGDVTKANTVLGWEAKRGLREALADSWRWQQYLASSPQ